ncbi:hypothetical protein D3C85_1230070 [compost metagenome]
MWVTEDFLHTPVTAHYALAFYHGDGGLGVIEDRLVLQQCLLLCSPCSLPDTSVFKEPDGLFAGIFRIENIAGEFNPEPNTFLAAHIQFGLQRLADGE